MWFYLLMSLTPVSTGIFWQVCGDDVIAACRGWLADGAIPSELNNTNITLIPKCDPPQSMRDLQPISLCNVAYKILAKTLANRLALVIPKCISEEQSTFIPGRFIIDSALPPRLCTT